MTNSKLQHTFETILHHVIDWIRWPWYVPAGTTRRGMSGYYFTHPALFKMIGNYAAFDRRFRMEINRELSKTSKTCIQQQRLVVDNWNDDVDQPYWTHNNPAVVCSTLRHYSTTTKSGLALLPTPVDTVCYYCPAFTCTCGNRSARHSAHATETRATLKPLKYSARDLLFGSLHWSKDGTCDIGCFDTMSQVPIHNSNMPLPADAILIASNDGTTVEGVGGHITKAGDLYSIDLELRLGSLPITFKFRLAPLTTPGLRWLWDLEQMRDTLSAEYDTQRSQLRAPKINAIIPLEPIEILHQRLSNPPIRMLSAGIPTGCELFTMLEMGNRIREYICVGATADQQSMITPLLSKTISTIIFFDNAADLDCTTIGEIDFAWFNPGSDNWTATSRHPTLEFDSPDALHFQHCGRLSHEIRTVNPNASVVFCTNRISRKSQDAAAIQETWAGSKYIGIEASDFGSPSKSYMRFAVHNLPIHIGRRDFFHSDPNLFINQGWRSNTSPTRSANDKRSSAITVVDNDGENPRSCSHDEKDSLLGYPRGFSAKTGDTVSENFRDDFISQCINQFHLRLILRYQGLNFEKPNAKITRLLQRPLEPVEIQPDKIELHLSAMSHSEKVAYIRQRFEIFDWSRVELDIEVTNESPYQTRQIPDVHKRFERAVTKSLQTSQERGHIIMETTHSSDDWISPMFFKGKTETRKDGQVVDRLDADGDPVVRKLCNLVVLNTYAKVQAWFREFCPRMDEFRACFSSDDDFFSLIDLADAYEFVRLAVRSRKYMVFVFRMNGKLYYVRALVAMQGLALSGYFFPVALWRLLSHAFGLAWTLWFAIYVDDVTVKGPTIDRTTARGLIFLAFCEAVNLSISPKTPLPLTVSNEVSAVGWVIDKHGSRADDTVVIATITKLQAEVTTLKQARYLRGVVQAAAGAWQITPGSARMMAELMAPWHRAITESNGKRITWDDDCRTNQVRMIPFLKSLPRAHIHPDELITDSTCLIYTTDSSDDAAGCAVWRVNITDARDVIVPEDLEDPQLSQIVWGFAKAHVGEHKEWLTYSTETDILVEAIEKTSNRVTQALLKFDPESEIKKIAFYSDSSTALSIAKTLNDPAYTPDFHTAKARKWLNWSQRVVMTNYWPAHWAFIQGIKNTLADWLSHVGHLILEQGKLLSTAKRVAVLTRSQQQRIEAAQRLYPVPEGWSISNSTFKTLSPTDWRDVSSATAADTTSTWFQTTISDMYAHLTSGGGSLAPLVNDRIKAWRTKVYAICPPGSEHPCLFVPRTFTRSEAAHFDSDDRLAALMDMSEISAKSHRGLVLVIPDKLDLRVSQIQPLEGEPAQYLRDDLILLFHEFNSHPTAPATLDAISEVAWFPSIRSIVYDHVLYCSLCMKRSSWRRLAGMGTVFKYRHRHLWGDHLILPPWLREITGKYAIFVLLDVGSGEVDAVETTGTGAEEVVLWLFNTWIRTRGFFYTFGSDHGSAFCSNVLEIFFKLIGLKVHKRSAVGDSRGMANVENKNKLMRKMEAEISENSSVRNLSDLQIFITRHLIYHNQVRRTAGSTVFERCRGEPAIQLGDLITADVDIATDLKLVDSDEAELLVRVADATRTMMEHYKSQQTDRARKNAYERDVREKRHRSTRPDFTIGQQLSLKGKRVTVIDLEGFDGDTHIIATVLEEGTALPKRVKCEDLRERCWPTPQWSPPSMASAKPGQFILFEDAADDGFRRGGVVQETADNHASVQEYAPNNTVTRWLPVWISPTGAQNPKRICPPGWAPMLTDVSWDRVKLTGTLSKESLSDDTRRRALALGLTWALPSKVVTTP